MKTTVNKVEICGFLGKDAEVRTLANGHSLIRLSVATNDYYKKPDGVRAENTTWHKVMMWKKDAAGMAENLKKGKLVHIAGRLNNRKYTDKNGRNHFITEVLAHKTEVAA